MFQLNEQFYNKSIKHNLKLAPAKSFFMLLEGKFLGHEIRYNTKKPIHSKVDANYKLPSPTSKVALNSFIGALNFYAKLIEKLTHLILLYEFLQLPHPISLCQTQFYLLLLE